MTPTLMKFVRDLTKSDKKSLVQKCVKLMEEVGEVAKAVLPFEGAFATTHRLADRESILEECVDSMICAMSIAMELEFSDSEIEDMMTKKTRKWASLQVKEGEAKWPIPFEIHVTIEYPDAKGLSIEDWARKLCGADDAFRAACRTMGVKPLMLDLLEAKATGRAAAREWMTSSVHMGTNTSALAEMHRIGRFLTEAGFKVERLKCESVPWHPAAPSSGTVVPDVRFREGLGADQYFECHMRVAPKEVTGVEAVQRALIERRMPMSIRADRSMTRHLMGLLRVHNTTREKFLKHVEATASSLREEGFEVDAGHVEFAVYDSNVDHDSSWRGQYR